MKKHILTVLWMITCLSLSLQVMALAVSDVELKSALNQQLNADVFLLAVNEGELDNLKIHVRSKVDQTGGRENIVLEYKLKQNDRGHYINITSQNVVREPILDLILELDWSGGRLIREYSLLIDPKKGVLK